MNIRAAKNIAVSISLLSLNLFGFNNCSSGFKSAVSEFSSLDSKYLCQGVTPIQEPLVRLTGVQFRNTVDALVMAGVPAVDVPGYNTSLTGGPLSLVIPTFPTEGSYGRGNQMIYDTQDQRLSAPLLQAEANYAYTAATFILASPSRLSGFVNHYANLAAPSACPSTVGNTGAAKACVDAFIQGFGLRALHRPVETVSNPIDAGSANPAAANDLAFYEGVYNDATNGGFDALISVMLLSPDTVFLNQMKGEAHGMQVSLSSYETANKLAYYYTDAPPDELLLAAAQAGVTDDTLSAQADRLFTLPGTRKRFADFYTQWIRPDAIPQLISTSNAPSTDLVALRTNAIQEMVDLTDYYTFGTSGRPADLISGNISFAKTADLAAIYGVSVWPGRNADGSYNPATLVSFPAGQPRAGLFTRAGYAFSGARDNNPIIRGSRIRKDYFCGNLNPPANFVLSPSVQLNGPPTVRNIVAANTEVTGTSCASCHKPLINPLGFALENYDAFGRYRTTEPLFNADGTINTTTPVDASSQPFLDQGETTTYNDPVAYSQAIGTSEEFNSCFTKHFFRFAHARFEQPGADACQLNTMAQTTANGGTIQSMVKAGALDPNFQYRFISP